MIDVRPGTEDSRTLGLRLCDSAQLQSSEETNGEKEKLARSSKFSPIEARPAELCFGVGALLRSSAALPSRRPSRCHC